MLSFKTINVINIWICRKFPVSRAGQHEMVLFTFIYLPAMCLTVCPSLFRSSVRWTSRRLCWTPTTPSPSSTSVPSTWRTRSACTCAFPKKGSSSFKLVARSQLLSPRLIHVTLTSHLRVHSWLNIIASSSAFVRLQRIPFSVSEVLHLPLAF